MEFTCPHCLKPFTVKMREGSTSPKANAARKRNARLAGVKPKTSPAVLERIYSDGLSRGLVWTGPDLAAAIKKETGLAYSRSRAFVLLRKLKAMFKPVTTDRCSFSNDKTAPVTSDVFSFSNEKTPKPAPVKIGTKIKV